jgi:hypothetical protein
LASINFEGERVVKLQVILLSLDLECTVLNLSDFVAICVMSLLVFLSCLGDNSMHNRVVVLQIHAFLVLPLQQVNVHIESHQSLTVCLGFFIVLLFWLRQVSFEQLVDIAH